MSRYLARAGDPAYYLGKLGFVYEGKFRYDLPKSEIKDGDVVQVHDGHPSSVLFTLGQTVFVSKVEAVVAAERKIALELEKMTKKLDRLNIMNEVPIRVISKY